MNTLKFKIIGFFFVCTLAILTLLTFTIVHFTYQEKTDALVDVLTQLSHDIVNEHLDERECDENLTYLLTLSHTKALLEERSIRHPEFMITSSPPPVNSMKDRLFVTTSIGKGKFFTVSSSTKFVDRAISRLLTNLIVAFSIGLFALTSMFYLILDHLLNPLDLLVKACDTFNETHTLDLSFPYESVEITKLVSALQGLLDKIDYLHSSEQAMIKKTAHEVKTPLAILKARIDLFARDPKMAKEEFIVQANNDIAKVLKHLKELFVVHEATKKNPPLETILLYEVVTSATALCTPLLSRKQQHLTLEGDNTFAISSYRSTLFRLFLTIVENCINHAPYGSEIFISIDEKEKTLTFKNQINHDEKPEIFSSNLGLRIVRELALSVKATVTIAHEETNFTLTLHWS